jgi:hypothetical protein
MRRPLYNSLKIDEAAVAMIANAPGRSRAPDAQLSVQFTQIRRNSDHHGRE